VIEIGVVLEKERVKEAPKKNVDVNDESNPPETSGISKGTDRRTKSTGAKADDPIHQTRLPTAQTRNRHFLPPHHSRRRRHLLWTENKKRNESRRNINDGKESIEMMITR